MDSKRIMDPLFSALEILILGQWKLDPRQKLLMGHPPVVPQIALAIRGSS